MISKILSYLLGSLGSKTLRRAVSERNTLLIVLGVSSLVFKRLLAPKNAKVIYSRVIKPGERIAISTLDATKTRVR